MSASQGWSAASGLPPPLRSRVPAAGPCSGSGQPPIHDLAPASWGQPDTRGCAAVSLFRRTACRRSVTVTRPTTRPSASTTATTWPPSGRRVEQRPSRVTRCCLVPGRDGKGHLAQPQPGSVLVRNLGEQVTEHKAGKRAIEVHHGERVLPGSGCDLVGEVRNCAPGRREFRAGRHDVGDPHAAERGCGRGGRTAGWCGAALGRTVAPSSQAMITRMTATVQFAPTGMPLTWPSRTSCRNVPASCPITLSTRLRA